MAAQYQHASDAVGGMPYSGVIRADGKWVACASDSTDWTDYLTWAGTEGNVVDPYLHPAQGGVKIVLEEGQVPVGVMLNSLPPEEGGNTLAGLPPKNVDVPMVSGDAVVGGTLTCTMGNWEGEPKLYSSGWVSDGGDQALAYGSEYVVQANDAGHSISCIVLATNDYGSTTAPPSNAVAIPAAGGVTRSTERAVPPVPPRQAEHEEHRHTRRKE
jgi:hypothetical protein